MKEDMKEISRCDEDGKTSKETSEIEEKANKS